MATLVDAGPKPWVTDLFERSMAHVFARQSVTYPARNGGSYTLHDVRAGGTRSIITRDNASAFVLKRKLNV